MVYYIYLYRLQNEGLQAQIDELSNKPDLLLVDGPTTRGSSSRMSSPAAKSLVATMCRPLAGSHSIRNAGMLLPKKLHELTELLRKT